MELGECIGNFWPTSVLSEGRNADRLVLCRKVQRCAKFRYALVLGSLRSLVVTGMASSLFHDSTLLTSLDDSQRVHPVCS